MSENFIYGNGTNRLYGVSDTIDSASSLTVASTKCVNNVYNNLKELIDSKGGGLPLGHIYLWPFSTPPDGSIQVNGSEYNRELYSDLWALVQEKGWYKPEAEWQQIASANGGYCPWYSDGDGSTTFRTPKFAPYQKLALASGDAGKYYEAGLPNITGMTNFEGYNAPYANATAETSCLYAGDTAPIRQYGNVSGSGGENIGFDASRSNPIYGNSTTVQPESHDWIVCVVAFGTATNVGSVDVANVMSAVSQVQAEVSSKLEDSTVHVIETWKSDDGTSWYRKWSDGFIEQGVKNLNARNGNNQTETLLVPFSTNTYTLVISAMAGVSENYDVRIKSTSTTSFIYGLGGNATGMYYVACGY